MKITSDKIRTIVEAIIAILLAVGFITSCTSSLFVLKGTGNKVRTEQNIKADSTTVSARGK